MIGIKLYVMFYNQFSSLDIISIRPTPLKGFLMPSIILGYLPGCVTFCHKAPVSFNHSSTVGQLGYVLFSWFFFLEIPL